MPVIRSAVRSVLSDAIRESVVSPWRYFSTFDPVLNTYGELDAAFTPAGDFEVEAQVSAVATGSQMTVLRGSGNDIIVLDISSTDTTRFWARVGGVTQTIISGASLNDGQLHTLKGVYTGTTAELFLDGASQGTATWALDGSQVVDTVGRTPSASGYFDGIIANVKLTDLATPANSRFFPVGLSGTATVENSTINSGSITYYNLPEANRERFTFDEPNQRWVGDGGSPILEVA
jgi:hypothetical protein